jgi:hypothetical protein
VNVFQALCLQPRRARKPSDEILLQFHDGERHVGNLGDHVVIVRNRNTSSSLAHLHPEVDTTLASRQAPAVDIGAKAERTFRDPEPAGKPAQTQEGKRRARNLSHFTMAGRTVPEQLEHALMAIFLIFDGNTQRHYSISTLLVRRRAKVRPEVR